MDLYPSGCYNNDKSAEADRSSSCPLGVDKARFKLNNDWTHRDWSSQYEKTSFIHHDWGSAYAVSLRLRKAEIQTEL